MACPKKDVNAAYIVEWEDWMNAPLGPNIIKICTKCKKEKSLSEFYVCKRDGVMAQCKDCQKVRSAKYHKENKKLACAATKRYKDRNKKFYKEYKKGLKCQICGENHSACLIFHHRNPNEKEFMIANSVTRMSIKCLMKEVAKCDVLCANCHKKLHYDLRGGI